MAKKLKYKNDFLLVLIFFPDKCMFPARNKQFVYVISKRIFTYFKNKN